jgi:hypothetical protein
MSFDWMFDGDAAACDIENYGRAIRGNFTIEEIESWLAEDAEEEDVLLCLTEPSSCS